MRQKLAGDGKGLPDAPEGEAGDEADKSEDVAFAWFGTAIVLPEPTPALPRLPVSANTIRLPEGQIAPVVAQPRSADAPIDAATVEPATEGRATEAVSAELSAPAAPAVQIKTPAVTDTTIAPERPAGPVRIELPPVQEQAVRTQPITIAAIQPRAEAVQPLAAPLAATTIEAPTTRRQLRETTISPLAATTAAEAPRAHAVPAMADAQQPALDLRSRDGMTSMIERIEALRDTPGARETSIRLSPDALGTVDISIRHEGDRVHVHFSAETPAARAALAEAQPRLAELAESRGLRLGQTSVDGGAAGQGQRQDAAPRPAFTTAPARAPSGDSTTDTDDRIA